MRLVKRPITIVTNVGAFWDCQVSVEQLREAFEIFFTWFLLHNTRLVLELDKGQRQRSSWQRKLNTVGTSGRHFAHEVVNHPPGLVPAPEVLPAVPVLHVLDNAISVAEPSLTTNKARLIPRPMSLKFVEVQT